MLQEDQWAQTALHVCGDQGDNPRIAQSLLRAGAHPNASDQYGRTPLHNAEKLSRVGIIKVLRAAGAKISEDEASCRGG